MLVSQVAGHPLNADGHIGSIQKGDSIVAQGVLVKISATQAYFVFGQKASSIDGKVVTVKRNENNNRLQLTATHEEREDRSQFPIYIQCHFNSKIRCPDAHIVDTLAENVLGIHNLELKKNITADFFEVTKDIQDEVAFIVTDRLQFQYLTFNVVSIKNTLKPSKDVVVTKYTSDDLNDVLDLDNVVSGYQRGTFVEEIVKKYTVFVAREDSRLVGLITGEEGRVHSLYAESQSIADALLEPFLKTQKGKQVSLFAPEGRWSGAAQTRRVFRRHTRAVPTCIDWSLVYSHNVGLSIV